MVYLCMRSETAETFFFEAAYASFCRFSCVAAQQWYFGAIERELIYWHQLQPPYSLLICLQRNALKIGGKAGRH